jgi:hypothetical protein
MRNLQKDAVAFARKLTGAPDPLTVEVWGFIAALATGEYAPELIVSRAQALLRAKGESA